MYEKFNRATHLGGLSAGASISRSVVVNESTTTGQILAVQNPNPYPVIVELSEIYIKAIPDAACSIDIGVAADGSTSSDNLIDGIALHTAPVNTVYNNIEDPGTNGKYGRYVPSGYYFTASVASGNANGLEATFNFDVRPVNGGQVGGNQLFS